MPSDTITLYYRQDGSDKVYQATIIPKDGLFVVTFAYGRRGSTLNTGCKTTIPVDYPTARAIFEKLVRDKKGKGYSEGAAGIPYQGSTDEDRCTGITPQLLNPVKADELPWLLHDPAWCMQEKFDGKRILIQVKSGATHGINRKGLLVPIPTPRNRRAKGQEWIAFDAAAKESNRPG